MNPIDILQSALYLVMNALLYPVVAALLFSIIAALFMTGGFVSEALVRRKQPQDMDRDHEALARTVALDLCSSMPENAADHISKHITQMPEGGLRLKRFLKSLALHVEKGADNLDIRAEKLLQTREHTLRKTLDKTRIMIRIGPMLGLMGTLIPMGPALLSLSQGDLTRMASCLMLAFGTTVAGLAVGVLAYVVSVFRERWHAEDISRMEYIVDLILGHLNLVNREDDEFRPPKLDVLSSLKVKP
jgi:biopolymer transport protein ExbB/TolQ